MRFSASHGSAISMNAQRPKPPWLFTAGTQSVRAVATLAALSFFFSPVTSTSRFSRSPSPPAPLRAPTEGWSGEGSSSGLNDLHLRQVHLAQAKRGSGKWRYRRKLKLRTFQQKAELRPPLSRPTFGRCPERGRG